MRVIVIVFLLLILASLGSALVFLYKDRGADRRRMARALLIRVSLSVTLFVMLCAGYYFGWITGKL